MGRKGRGHYPSNRSSSAARVEMVDAPSRQLDAAQRLFREGRYNDAFDLFNHAIRLESNNVRAYVMAARAYAERFCFDRMEAIHEQLVARAPRHPGVHHYIGETYAAIKLPAKALQSYERAASLPGAGPPTWMELASLYERSHQLDDAREFIERTVASDYEMPVVGLVRARVQRRLGEIERAEATLLSLIDKYPGDNQWVCQAWGELAMIRDRQGDFDGAIEAIERCKQIQRMRETPYWQASEKIHDAMRQLIDQVTDRDFDRWRVDAAELPQWRVALLTGFPRSGTTLLEQLLDSHPDLVSSEERDFVGQELYNQVVAKRGAKSLIDCLNETAVERIALQRDRYFPVMEYLLGEAIDGRMHLDKNPAYNLTIPIMLRFFPEARIIVALRDPRDVVLSCYLRYLPLNTVSVRFLTPERTAERYALDMRAWLKYRDLIETSWCEIRYEDTVADLARQARRALDTLGLSWDDRVLGYRQRLIADKQVTSPSYEAVAEPIYTRAIGRWRNYEQFLEPALEILEPFIREFGYEPS